MNKTTLSTTPGYIPVILVASMLNSALAGAFIGLGRPALGGAVAIINTALMVLMVVFRPKEARVG